MNNPIEELRRMEVPVTEEEWTAIVNDKRYVQKFGRKPGLSPKGRAALVAGIAAVLITVPVLVKTLRQQSVDQTQPATPATEVVAPQPSATPTAITPATTSPSTSSQKSTTAPTTAPETKPTVATTTQAATHEGSTMASVVEKRQPAVTPTTTSTDKLISTTPVPKLSETKSTPATPVSKPATKELPKQVRQPQNLVATNNEETLRNQPSENEEPEAEAEQFFIPTAFTPNGDGLNDLFYVTANFEPQKFEMYIFTRGSELLFSTRDMSIGWDGTKYGSFLPQGVYVYLIKYVDRHGNEQKRQGQVLLIP